MIVLIVREIVQDIAQVIQIMIVGFGIETDAVVHRTEVDLRAAEMQTKTVMVHAMALRKKSRDSVKLFVAQEMMDCIAVINQMVVDIVLAIQIIIR